MPEKAGRVLVVSPQAPRSEAVAKALEARELAAVPFETAASALTALPQTEVVAAVIELGQGDEQLVELLQQLRASDVHRAIPIVLVGNPPKAALEAAAGGPSQALSQHSSAPALVHELGKLLEAQRDPQERRTTSAPPPAPTGGRKGAGELWVVCGPRGGVGRTILASNLAVLAAADGLKAAMVDNVPRFGGGLMAFDLPSQTPSWVELADLSLDENLLDRITRHPSGVSVLPAPSRPELADSVSPAKVGSLIFRLTHLADLVVVDQGGRLDNGGIDIMESADHVILVGTPDNPGVVGLRGWLRICDQLGIARARIAVVLNCVLPYHQVDAQRAKRVLEQPVMALPHAGIDGVRSLSGGEPLGWKHQSNRWVKAIRSLAAEISPELKAKTRR